MSYDIGQSNCDTWQCNFSKHKRLWKREKTVELIYVDWPMSYDIFAIMSLKCNPMDSTLMMCARLV